MPRVIIDGTVLTSIEHFHDQFAAALGFIEHYGRNPDAWIDCMDDVGLRTVRENLHDPLAVVITDAHRSDAGVIEVLIHCTAVVNRRRTNVGLLPPIHLHIKRR